MIPARLDWLYAGVALAAVGAFFFLLRRWKLDPAQAERRRRERIGRIGRVAPCEILDILQDDAAVPVSAARSRVGRLVPLQGLFVLYRYTVAGVAYETSQDFTVASPGAQPPRPGQIASVKYDPNNPSNSVLVAGSWSKPSIRATKPATPGTGK